MLLWPTRRAIRSIGTSASESSETKLCRCSRGVHSWGSRAHLRRARPDGQDVNRVKRARPIAGKMNARVARRKRPGVSAGRRAVGSVAAPGGPGDRPHTVPAVPARYRARPDDQAISLARGAQKPEKSQPPGRSAAHCPGRPLHPQGHPRILSNRSAERIFRTHPCTRSL